MEIPIAMRWKISKKEMRREFEEEEAEGFLCKKYYFTEPRGIGYRLFIGYDEDKDEVDIGLGIYMNKPTLIKADIFMTTNTTYFKITPEFKKDRQLSGKYMCTIDKLFDPARRHFIDGYFTIKMEGILSFENERINSTIKNSNGFGEALWNRDNKDFDIHVGEKIIKIHKCIVGTRSSVFERMFQSGMKESKENKVGIVDFDFDIVEIAMKFCYGIEITQLLNVSDGIELLQFADKYDIVDLKNAMEEYLFNQRTLTNIVEIVNASLLFNSSKLQKQGFEFMLECNRQKIFVRNLEQLDKDFAVKLLKATFVY